MASNKAAWLLKANTPLEVSEAPTPTAGPGELVVCNAAIAINPLDCHMQDSGVFVKQWPAILGCDVAGEVYEVGSGVHGRFKKGDRVIGHTINLISGRTQDAAFALYTVVPADKAAILPDAIAYTDGVVVPFALEAAVCVLSLKQSGTAKPGIATPALDLPYPSLDPTASTIGKTLVVYGGSSSVGSMVIQLATAAGLRVISIASARNFGLSKTCGAVEVFDYHDPSFVDKVVEAVASAKSQGSEGFVGIFDAISTPETYKNNLAILSKLGGVWRGYVTPALQAGKLKCLPPPFVVEKGLEKIQDALEQCRAGVNAMKLVVEL